LGETGRFLQRIQWAGLRVMRLSCGGFLELRIIRNCSYTACAAEHKWQRVHKEINMTDSENSSASAVGPERARIAQQFIEALPYARELGMVFDEFGNGRAVLSMAYRDDLIGDPDTGVIHGGVVSALMDTCSGAAVLSHPTAPISTATIDLRIDYMRPATPGQRLTAIAECYNVTRSVAFVRATTLDEDPDRPVATATGTFTLERPK
jgi:uncharacterized protein (TIGR00369 family)